MDWINMISTRL